METFLVTGIEYAGNDTGDYLATEMKVSIDTASCMVYDDIISLISKFIFDAMSFHPVKMEIA
jgi:hypothetical protein